MWKRSKLPKLPNLPNLPKLPNLSIVLLVVMLGTLGAASRAQAAEAAGPLPVAFLAFHWGDHIFEAGPLPQKWLDKHPERKSLLEDKKAGFKCKTFFVLWALVYRQDCTPVAYSGKKFFDESKLAGAKENWIADLNQAIADNYSIQNVKMGFWAKNGKFILGGVLLLFIVLSIVRKVRS